MNKILLIFLISLAVSQCGIPFVYTEADPHDPENVAKVREALMHVGVSPDGITVISFLEKFEVLRVAYKATFMNRQGQQCFIKWRIGQIFGTQTPKMPICENVAIGKGSDPLRIQFPPTPQVVVYPTQGPAIVYQPRQEPVIVYQTTQRPVIVVQPPYRPPYCITSMCPPLRPIGAQVLYNHPLTGRFSRGSEQLIKRAV